MRCRHSMPRFDYPPTRATWGARCGKSARRVLRGGTGTSDLVARLVPTHHSIVRENLVEMMGRRVTDGSMLRLIGKWIRGAIDGGKLIVSETGTGQGQPISPLLANIYLHQVLDEWFEKTVKPRLKGEAHEVRYADDAILCFQYREDAEKVLEVLPKRFAKFGLTLHPEKTRLIAFGRFAKGEAKKQGKKKPDTFDFLGFTHICAHMRQGQFTVHVETINKRLRRGLKSIADWCKRYRH